MPTIFYRGSFPAFALASGGKALQLARQALWFLEAAVAVAGERRRLARLDDRLLKDVGLSSSVAAREASRDFLDVPAHRIRRR